MAVGQIKQKQTPEVIGKLEVTLATGATIKEACFVAGIAESTYHLWCSENEKLSERFRGLRDTPVLKAREVVAKALEDGDIGTAKWYLERQRKSEFATQTHTEHSGNVGRVEHIESEYVSADKGE